MADLFDIESIIFDAVEKANTGLPAYKGRAERGIQSDFIVINSTGMMVNDQINKAPVVNVNLFTRLLPNGMTDAKKVKRYARLLRESLKEPRPPKDVYFVSRIEFEADLREEVESGFDCYNFRLSVITE